MAATTPHGCRRLILTVLLASFTAAPAYGENGETAEAPPDGVSATDSNSSATSRHRDHVPRRCSGPKDRDLFFDDFEGPTLNPIWQAPLPNAPYRFGSVNATFLGESNFSFESLDGTSVIRLHNILDNTQRRGWSSSTSFPSDAPIVYEARFNTLVQSRTTGIDELLEMWLLDSDNPDNYDIVALSTPNFGRGRIFTSGSSITGLGLDTSFAFENNTWYRMVISGSPTQEVRASIYDDARSAELISVNFGHTLSAYTSGFKLGISQSMGFPDSPFPTDVAIDWVRLTTPPSATVVIGDCNSQVSNPVFPSGCAISDLIAECGEDAGKHGRFVKCVVHLTNDLKEAGVITRRQGGAIRSCAEQANIP